MSATGQWNVTINSPMGAQQGTLALEDGKADGASLSWAANVTSPMPIKLEFSAEVNGDEISGTVKLGAFGNASFSGSRA